MEAEVERCCGQLLGALETGYGLAEAREDLQGLRRGVDALKRRVDVGRGEKQRVELCTMAAMLNKEFMR